MTRRPPARCVLHPSALVTAFFGVRTAKVLEAWRRGDVVLCVSDAVLAHYRALSTTFDMWPDELERFLRDLGGGREPVGVTSGATVPSGTTLPTMPPSGATVAVMPPVEWIVPMPEHAAPPFPPHPEDSDVATCAHAAGAPVVCVDRHMLGDEGQFAVRAMTPVDFVNLHVARAPLKRKPAAPPSLPPPASPPQLKLLS